MNDETDKRSYSDEELDRIIREFSDLGKERPERHTDNSMKQQEKKFVVHIDESIIENDIPRNDVRSGNTGGIYFTNYSKHKNSPSTASGNSRPVQQRTAQTQRQSSAKKQTEKKNIERIGGRAAAGFLAFIIISTILLSYLGLTCVGDMLAINRSDENVQIDVPEGATYTDIIDTLKENGLIKQKLFCKLFTKYRDFDDETYLSGTYYLSCDMGVEGMLMDLMSAPVTAETVTLSFPEGWTLPQIIEKIDKYDVCDSNKLYAALESDYSAYSFVTDIKSDEKRYEKLEGYLFPDTYDFYVGADANYVIKKFLDNFKSKWEDEYDARAKKLGYTRDEIIVIASIIQKEAANAEQMKIVSSVVHNRLNNSADFPTLGCDSTAIYISNFVTPVVGTSKGNYYYDNYDTGAIKGLPPGPICNPGMDAIRAALYPEETDYYYFAHDNSGKIYTAKTINEHRSNLVKIIQANSGR